MNGQLYIDGKDVYANFGLYVVEQGLNGLIQWAALKAVAYNDWHEEDGIEPDLSSPTLDSKEFTISLVGATSRSRAMAFIEAFGGNAYHALNAASIGRNYNVRLVSAEPVREEAGIYFVDITLADDFPLQGYVPQAPRSSIERVRDYLIDDAPFTDYGVRILEGSLAEITRCADVKPNLERDIASQGGRIYHNGKVRYSAYEATLSCLMRASSLNELWRNYDALLYRLTAPGTHHITVEAMGKRYPCHYVDSEVVRFYPTDKIWLEFEITINVISTPK